MTSFNNTFIEACFGRKTTTIPVWFMRQAGRSLPGYREFRKQYGVLEIAQTPEIAAQVSLESVELLGVDAAILFADIMLLPLAMGVELEIMDAVGPVIAKPIVSADDVRKLQPLDSSRLDYLSQTVKLLRNNLKVPLIGFSGAPFTLASYLIEGKPTRTWTKTKSFMLDQPTAWAELMGKLTDAVIIYVDLQIAAGAQAVQLFDSWVGCLSPDHYRQFVLPYSQKVFSGLANREVPRIHFGTDTAGMLRDFANVDCEVIGVDWRLDLGEAKKLIGTKAIQGNLDPAVLLGSTNTIERECGRMLDNLPSRQGYIFNLGHGMLPETDDAMIRHLVDFIHAQ